MTWVEPVIDRRLTHDLRRCAPPTSGSITSSEKCPIVGWADDIGH